MIIKLHWKSVISTPGAKYMTFDVKDFKLNMPMDHNKYIRIPIYMIPPKFMDKYNLHDKIYNGYVYAEVRKGMYILLQAGCIAHNHLVMHLKPYMYVPMPLISGLWKHKNKDTTFNLMVNNFGVKYLKVADAEYSQKALEDKYKVTTDLQGKVYVGITLKWNNTQCTIQLFMPGNVQAALHQFQHHTPLCKQDSPYP